MHGSYPAISQHAILGLRRKYAKLMKQADMNLIEPLLKYFETFGACLFIYKRRRV